MSLPALALLVAGLSKTPVDAVNKNRQGVALRGYDPVTYREQNRPVKGAPGSPISGWVLRGGLRAPSTAAGSTTSLAGGGLVLRFQ